MDDRTEQRRIDQVREALIEKAGLDPEQAIKLVAQTERERGQYEYVVPLGLQSIERYNRKKMIGATSDRS